MDLEKWIPAMRQRDEMLSFLGMDSVEDLFADLPFTTESNLDHGKEEKLVKREVLEKLKKNSDPLSFIGMGVYHIYVPPLVHYLISRSEFLTTYTPYQAEAMQGILQALFEFQSLIAELTGMDVVNASVYDGATALGEGALMAKRINGKREILVPELYWEKRSVLENYLAGSDMEIRDYPQNGGKIDLDGLSDLITDSTSCVYAELPNLYGLIDEGIYRLHEFGPLVMIGVNPLLLSIIKPPEADIIVGEGQILGLDPSFGGPLLGIMGSKREHMRQLPGRIVGATEDAEGRRGFCLTLQAREQHIRREKALSNLCTSQTLCALACAIYIELMGAKGLRRLACELMEKSKRLRDRITDLHGFRAFTGTYFNEFAVESDFDWRSINRYLLENGVLGGYVIGGGKAVFAVSEEHTDEDFDRLVELLGGYNGL